MEKSKKFWNIITILFIFFDLIAISGLVIMYGPKDYYRNLYITTAMKTRNHQYLAYVFYREKTVDKIMIIFLFIINSFLLPFLYNNHNSLDIKSFFYL